MPTRILSDSNIFSALEDRVTDLETAGSSGAVFLSGGPVACATTANITLSGEQTIDGVLTSTSRVLVKNQTAPEENGIYVTASGAWSRATDMDAAGEVVRKAVSVTGGTTQASDVWATYSTVTTLGTDAINWVQAQDGGAIDAALALKADLTEVAETADALRLSLGEEISEATFVINAALVATALADGFTVPSGSTGVGSYVLIKWPFTGADWTGVVVDILLELDISNPSEPVLEYQFDILRSAGVVNRTSSTTISSREATGKRFVKFRYTIQGDELELRPRARVKFGSPATSADETVQATGLRFAPVDAPNVATSAGELALAQREAAQQALLRAELVPSLGDRLETGTYASAPGAGGGTRDNALRRIDLAIGVTGDNFLVTYTYPLDASWTGVTADFDLVFEASDPFTPTFDSFIIYGVVSGADVNRTATGSVTQLHEGTERRFQFRYPVQGDETAVKLTFKFNNAIPVAQAEHLTMTGATVRVTAAPDGETVADVAARLRDADTMAAFMAAPLVANYASLAKPIYADADYITVSPGGGGDYTTPEAAIASLSNRTVTTPALVDIMWGDYELSGEITLPKSVTLRGRGIEQTRLFFLQPDSTAEADISLYSAILLRETARLEGLHIEVENARYGIHAESGGTRAKHEWDIVNCRVIHRGNPSPNNAWPVANQDAVGCGNSSGASFLVQNCHLEAAQGRAFALHTWEGYADPSWTLLQGNTLIGGAQGIAVNFRSVASEHADAASLIGNTIRGQVECNISGWTPDDATYEPANRHEFHVVGYANSPAVYTAPDTGQALRITSATTGGSSSVAVSGTAVAALFGDTVSGIYRTREGSAGLAGSVWGWGNVGASGVSMGARLGDCSGTSKTLTVTVDGGSPVNVVFSTDMTAVTNATILTTINTALGAAATADVFSPGALYRPRITDEEAALKNNSGTAILRGSVLAYDGDRETVRLMTSADAASLFAGVAMDDIATATVGRVKTKGWLHIDDLSTAESSLTFNATMSVGGTAGTVAAGGSQGILRAVSSDVVEIA